MAQTIPALLRMSVCGVTMPYSRKLSEHCKPAIMTKKRERENVRVSGVVHQLCVLVPWE